MKTIIQKKYLPVLLAVAMLIYVLAGCGAKNDTPSQSDIIDNEKATPVGMLVLATEAAVKISYDTNANVIKMEGVNEYGAFLIDEYTEYEGKSCADVVKDMINASVNAGNLSPDIKNVVLKLAAGSVQPTADFLSNVETAVQSALDVNGSVSKLVVIDESDLDAEGYINLEVTKTLLMNHLGVDKLDAYYGSTTPADGQYICTVNIGGEETSWVIDAVIGQISQATEEDLMNDPETTEYLEDYDYTDGEDIADDETEFIEDTHTHSAEE